MALKIQRTSPLKARILSTIVMVFALVLQPLVALNVPAAFAVGTPGQVVINEFNSKGSSDWVELYNTTGTAVDINGWKLTDSTTNEVALSGSVSAHGFVSYEFSNRLGDGGDTVRVVDEADTEIDSVVYGLGGDIAAPDTGEFAARASDGSATWELRTADSRDASNNISVATPDITNVDAYYASGTGYTGIGIDFTVENVSNVTGVKLSLDGYSSEYSIEGQAPLFNSINTNAASGGYTTSGTVIVTGSRTSSSGSWETMAGTWTGSSRPTTATVTITLSDSTVLTMSDNTIVDNGGNTQATVFASVPPTPVQMTSYKNGFETDTHDWNGTIDRVASGTGGIDAASGDFYAQVGEGANTYWGNSGSNVFPDNGYTTEVDLYLDMAQADGASAKRISWNGGISDAQAQNLEETAIFFQTDPNNANQWQVNFRITGPFKSSPWTQITETGWYTLQHHYREGTDGYLYIDMAVLDAEENVISAATYGGAEYGHVVDTEVGGADYGWFPATYTDFATVSADNACLYLGAPVADGCGFNVPVITAPEIHSVRFSTMSKDNGASYDGVVIDSYMKGFTDAKSIKVEIERADGSKVFRRGNHLTRNHINQGGDHALTTPFSFDGNTGDAWWNPQDAEWTKATKPVRITITVNTESHGKITFSTPIGQELVVTNGTYSSLVNPSTPTNLHRVAKDNGEVLPCGVITTRQILFPTWDTYADNEDIDYFNYKTSKGYTTTVPDNSFDTHNSMPSADGTNAYRVQAVDTYGNMSEWSDWCEVTYDSTAPVVTLHGLVDGEAYQGPVDIVASIVDENLSHYYLSIWRDGTKVATPETFKNKNVDGLTDELLMTLSEGGTYLVRLAAKDKAGNKDGSASEDGDSVKTVSFTIDSTAPVVTFQLPIDGTVVSGNVHTRSRIANETDLVHRVTYIDGVIIKDETNTQRNSEIKFNSNDYTDGVHTIRVVATDKAGNVGEASQTFTIDNSPVLSADYFTVHADQIAVGFSIDRFDDATKVEIELFEADGTPIAKNVGDSTDMVDLLNSHTGQISSPFYIPSQPNDSYWTFGTPDWANVLPAYAVVTVFYGSGDKLDERVDFVSANPDIPAQTYAALIANLPSDLNEDEEEEEQTGSFFIPAFTPTILGTTPTQPFSQGFLGGNVGTETPASENNPVTQGSDNANNNDILGEQDQEEGTALEDTGEVLGLMDQKFLGIGLYWYLIILAAIVGAWLLLAAAIRRSRAQE